MCAPSRTAFFTGRHSGQYVKHGYPGTNLTKSMNVTTTADILRDAGYATALIGKAAPLNSPLDLGFDHFVGQINQGYCHNMYPHFIDEGRGQANVNMTLN